MGLIEAGQWVDKWYDTGKNKGEFVRQESRFRDSIVSPGDANDKPRFVAESGRYHLFVALACPWAHRTLIFRALKGLTPHIGVTVVKPLMLENGWEFDSSGDDLYRFKYLYELYLKAAPDYEGRVTVPVLWDKTHQTIVNNESAEIIRILNSQFNALTGNSDDYYPAELATQIDHWNARIYERVNNGVYRAGFATTQAAYEEAFDALFSELDAIEDVLKNQSFLTGETLTEADWRLFTTLIRFDAVYHGYFKCNRQKLAEYTHISRYVHQLYHIPEVARTVDIEAIKLHYYGSHKTINPTGIIPKGPELHW